MSFRQRQLRAVKQELMAKGHDHPSDQEVTAAIKRSKVQSRKTRGPKRRKHGQILRPAFAARSY